MPPLPSRPVRLAIVNDYEIVVVGIAGMLAPYAERVVIVELVTGLPVRNDVDVVLYDTFGRVPGDDPVLTDLIAAGPAKVVVFTWGIEHESVTRAMADGAAGHLSKALTGLEVVRAIEAVHAGRIVTPEPTGPGEVEAHGDWPGRTAGLSPREAEILVFVMHGLSNQEIAYAAYLSINSVKTYIRTAYRKIGVTRRSQAVSWAIHHGLEPRESRVEIDS